jgi:hypothetical protein
MAPVGGGRGMTYKSQPELLVLHSLRLKGFAEPSDVSDATTLSEDRVTELLTAFREQEIVGRRDGRISGFMLTPAGKERHAVLLDEERTRAACLPRVEWGYDAFLAYNETFKQLCSDWQLRTVGGKQVPNDHTDAAYDAAIAGRLTALQARVAEVLDEIGAVLTRFSPYGDRLDNAVTRFVGGETAALSRPLNRSYHDVWMELHEDLLLTLGRNRGEGDGY